MENENTYQMFQLLGNEFTFDVDVSNIGCGLNGALYFVSMDADGGKARYPANKAGAKYGTGYCDAQCPRDVKFINGKVSFNPRRPNSRWKLTST
jgi:cellulose 1,4-beta-cellobiosidase